MNQLEYLLSHEKINDFCMMFQPFGVHMEIGNYGERGFVVEWLLVEPEFRGQGLASYAMDVICSFASSANMSIWLRAYGLGTDNKRLLRFYESKGFVLQDDEEMWMMYF